MELSSRLLSNIIPVRLGSRTDGCLAQRSRHDVCNTHKQHKQQIKGDRFSYRQQEMKGAFYFGSCKRTLHTQTAPEEPGEWCRTARAIGLLYEAAC